MRHDLTHDDLVDVAVKWLRKTRRCPLAVAELVTALPVTPDAIGWAAHGWSILVEVKVSRSDFRRDRKKSLHQLPDRYPGQERWYLTPPGLVTPDEVPEAWGLMESDGGRPRPVKQPIEPHWMDPPGHPAPKWGPHGLVRITRAGRTAAEQTLLLSVVRRLRDGQCFDEGRGRFGVSDAA